MKPLHTRIWTLSAVLLLLAAALPAAANCSCAAVQACACCEEATSNCSPSLEIDCAADLVADDGDLLKPSASVELLFLETSSSPDSDAVEPADQPVVATRESPPAAPSYLRLCTLLI